MWDDLAVDQVPLLSVVDDDLVELHVLGEEQVAVSEATASRRLGRQHVLPVTPAPDGEYAHTIVTAALEVAELVDLLLALFVAFAVAFFYAIV